MQIRATLLGNIVEVRALISHIMETGHRKDENDQAIPAHFIQQVTATHNGRVVLSAQWGPAISRDPYLEFRFRGGVSGDQVSISWEDNRGDRGTGETVIG